MYKRVLIKLSGEALFGGHSEATSSELYQAITHEIKQLTHQGIQVALMVGGGNIFRGVKAAALGMPRIPSDHIGMVATLLNGLLLQQSFSLISCASKVLSAFPCSDFVESYRYDQAITYLEEGKVVIFVGGTGLPYVSTDTAAALRAIEIKADILLKATKVDGIYDKDPKQFSDAKRFSSISYQEMIASRLHAMDLPSVALCMDNHLPILVFDIFAPNSLKRSIFHSDIGTLVTGDN